MVMEGKMWVQWRKGRCSGRLPPDKGVLGGCKRGDKDSEDETRLSCTADRLYSREIVVSMQFLHEHVYIWQVSGDNGFHKRQRNISPGFFHDRPDEKFDSVSK